MNQSRLNDLTLVSTEYKLLRKLDMSAIVKEFSVKSHVTLHVKSTF